jgi:hypothetical protein
MASVGLYLVWRVVKQFDLNRDLVLAIKREDVSAVRGADPNARSGAAYLTPRQIIALLWRHQDVTEGDPALSLALAEDGHGFTRETSWQKIDRIVRSLLEHGARVEAKSSEGWTPLMQAASAGRHELIKTLVAYGADVNAQTDQEVTVLMHAVMSRDDRTVEEILKCGAQPVATLHGQFKPEYYLDGCWGYNTPIPAEVQKRENRIRWLIAQARSRLRPRDTH